jgi:predicted transcriptional regulator of viral defense system
MKFEEFKKIFAHKPVIRVSHLYLNQNKKTLLNELSYWQKKGLIIKLKKGIYVFNEENRKMEISRLFIANELYFPSYISCEYALYFYGLIPEKVEDITSVTTKKTRVFKNPFGVFRYYHIKPSLFSGFRKVLDENNLPFLIATPEKAVFDFVYFNLRILKDKGEDVFEYSYRFQNIEDLNTQKLREIAKKVKNKTLHKVVDKFISFAGKVKS